MINITIYRSKLCPFSKQLISDLQKVNVPFAEKCVDKNIDAVAEMYKLTHNIFTPVIKIIKDGEEMIMIGYNRKNKGRIKELLNTELY